MPRICEISIIQKNRKIYHSLSLYGLYSSRVNCLDYCDVLTIALTLLTWLIVLTVRTVETVETVQTENPKKYQSLTYLLTT